MRYTQLFMPTIKETPGDTDVISYKLMVRAGLIRKLAAGIYEWLPVGYRILKKVEQIIRQEMDAIGGQEVWLPALLPRSLWDETGRWDVYGKELLRIKDRHEREFALGPTHEEIITDLVRKNVKSYKELPLLFYQLQTKFRDEIRPRFGIMRAREFYMKDAYSFHADATDAQKWYKIVFDAYNRIFKRCGFQFRAVEALTGAIGGQYSHEFMVLADTGEEGIVSCSCGYSADLEKAGIACEPQEDGAQRIPLKETHPCKRCGKALQFARGIEVGHTFMLGTKYSHALHAVYNDAGGKEQEYAMGCYGIGVSRIVAAAIEQNHDADGIIWPMPLAPFQVIIIPIDYQEEHTKKVSDMLYTECARAGIDVLLDDRLERAGVKFKDADLIGIPIRITISEKKISNDIAELKMRNEKNVRDIPLKKIIQEITTIISPR